MEPCCRIGTPISPPACSRSSMWLDIDAQMICAFGVPLVLARCRFGTFQAVSAPLFFSGGGCERSRSESWSDEVFKLGFLYLFLHFRFRIYFILGRMDPINNRG
jgi:hypothetical protein